MRRALRADLSGPVLAIIITVAIIAAGIGLMAYFWWLAPHASKTPTLTVIGTPALQVSGDDTNGYTIDVYVTVKNDGTDAVQVQSLVITDDNGAKYTLNPAGGSAVTVNPGQKVQIDFEQSGLTSAPAFSKPSYSATILTDGGVIPVTVYVVG